MRKTKTRTIPTTLIAPCGMNCRLCRAFLREKNHCPGCRGDDTHKSKACVTCKIKNCEPVAKGEVKFCFSCSNFPCTRLNQLDKRYRTKYGMSMVDNLLSIREHGVRFFIGKEKERWKCPECAEILCVHKPHCLCCGYRWR